ncbi:MULTISPECIES: aminotransferase class I/II-fold pyridoxal phosphate-dependent enzyme [unclassified Aeromicrobium]|uniref:aminotransferase class I/II-fold pyridoxal phosphate-dependent enzyme n=1 Tax=unclassified Aeromicrobium TaxID=2633570 RepID=UPI00396B2929
MNDDLTIRTATPEDVSWALALRHRVYAEELGQHPTNADGRLTDALDGDNVYLVAARGDEPVGFVSVTPPWVGRFGLDKYVTREDLPLLDEPDVFEVRILTVRPDQRHTGVATLLMYAAMRWVASRGGRTIVAMGRSEVMDLYRAVGLVPTGRTVTSGSVDFEVMTTSVAALTSLALGPFAELVERWRATVAWELDAPFATRPDGCEHGGASFGAIGTAFRTLERRTEVVAADVLDAWFDPAPGAQALLAEDPGWLARTSPPSDAEGLLAEIAAHRGLPVESLAVGSGSSDLIFRAFTSWLTPSSRVLLVDPGYGEYAHVTERVVGCHVERFALRREDGWRVDTERLAATVADGAYELVVVVNPNNPTGRLTPADDLRRAVTAAPSGTRWWVDEAYLGYVGPEESLAELATSDPRLVVCTSLSKMYALSGMRAAYLVAHPETATAMRRLTPPWQVSLPAQVAAVAALRDPDHYRDVWDRTHELRRDLAKRLDALGGLEVEDSVANFLCLTLPRGGPSAASFVAALRERDVFLRDLSPLSPAYEGRTVRVAVRDLAENDRIVAACAEVLGR